MIRSYLYDLASHTFMHGHGCGETIGNHASDFQRRCWRPKPLAWRKAGREQFGLICICTCLFCNSFPQCFSRRDSGSFASHYRAFEDSGSAVPICSSVSQIKHIFGIFSVLSHHATGIKKPEWGWGRRPATKAPWAAAAKAKTGGWGKVRYLLFICIHNSK